MFRIPTPNCWCLIVALCLLCGTEMKASAFSTPPTRVVVSNYYCNPHASSLLSTTTQRQPHLPPLFSSNNNNNNNNNNDETDNLLEKARKLRQEVSAIESTKAEIQKEKDAQQEAKRAEQREVQKQMQKQRMRYSAEVPILKDMGDEVMERVDFPPRLKGGKSRIITVQAPLPLGLVLGQDESIPGLTSVDEVSPDGNGASAGILQGDIVRAITACQTTMETPTWQLLAGGIGQPKTKRFVYSVDGRPLEEVLEAMGSNRMDVMGRDVWLVLERID